jgi:lipopolysaccharide biosynthesis regulator YciM
VDPRNVHALAGRQKLHEDQRQWREAYETQTRLARMRKSDDALVLGFLQAEMGREALRSGRRDAAEESFLTALSLDRRVFPAHLALAELWMERDPRRAARILEDAAAAVPERAYLAFDALQKAYAACGEPSRFAALCERLVGQDPRDWRARLALARQGRAGGHAEEALGLLLRALEANPHVLLVHLEVWRTLRVLGALGPDEQRYVATVEESALYVDPHICTACRYRADDMLWRCPHCHEWNTFVEERVSPAAGTR